MFTPWDESIYVVLDVTAAIFSNPNLLYLAHTHEGVPTIWQKEGIELEPLEWRRHDDGMLVVERTLPNRVAFGTRVVPRRDHVAVEQWLTNGTDKALTGLRVQDCVLLNGAHGFAAQTNTNKVIRKPYVGCRSQDGRRWIIAAWNRAMGHGPTRHAPACIPDPRFWTGGAWRATVRARGGVWLKEGPDIEAELRRIELTGWRGADGRRTGIDKDLEADRPAAPSASNAMARTLSPSHFAGSPSMLSRGRFASISAPAPK